MVAGFVDAAAFVTFGGLFVSFASGNSTQLAALPVQGRLGGAGASGAVILLFVMGAFAGRLIGLAAGTWRRPAVLAVVSGLLLLAALAASRPESGAPAAMGVAAMALAMGAQNAVMTRTDGVRAGLTYVTGTMVGLGHALADAVLGRPSRWSVYLLLWLGLVTGAALGAQGAMRAGPIVLLLPAAVAALLALALGTGLRRRALSGKPS